MGVDHLCFAIFLEHTAITKDIGKRSVIKFRETGHPPFTVIE